MYGHIQVRHPFPLFFLASDSNIDHKLAADGCSTAVAFRAKRAWTGVSPTPSPKTEVHMVTSLLSAKVAFGRLTSRPMARC